VPALGYVTAGRLTVRYGDRQEVIEPGDAFYMPPGHVPAAVAGTELVMFSPQDELAAAEAAMRELMMHKGNGNCSPYLGGALTNGRDQAEHAAESLSKGSRVVVVGRLQQRSWTAEDGSARSVVEIVADELGPSLRWATATTTRTTRSQDR
jgi:hypothetical protein